MTRSASPNTSPSTTESATITLNATGSESGDDAKRHASIIERRWLGSPPPTAERYALAVRQWHALPGAVIQPATDVAGSEDNAQPPASNPNRTMPANVESDT